jgi:tetratricopeptide (TPR) repeat protein
MPRPGLARGALTLILAIALAGQGLFTPLATANAARREAVKGAGAAEASNFELRVGVGAQLTRLEFRGPPLIRSRREGQVLVLRFAMATTPLIPRLHVDPPPFITSATAEVVGGQAEVRLTLADGADARVAVEDGAAAVILTSTATAAGDARADPTPVSGQVKMTARMDGPAAVLRFPWRAPVGAAVFRRAGAVWIVFDTPAAMDLSALPTQANTQGRSPLKSARIVSGKTFVAVRIASAPSANIAVEAEGAVWTVIIGGPPLATPPAQAPIAVDEAGAVGLSVALAGATGVFWPPDPVVGDTLAVVTALPPSKGVPVKRAFVGGAVLATAQGVAVEALSDKLSVTADRDLVRISGPGGLPLAAAASGVEFGAAALSDPQPAIEPAMVDFANWPRVGEGGFHERYAQLMSSAAREVAEHKPGKVQARLALARFLVGSELGFEAIGVLNHLAKTDPSVLGSAEFRGLRGVAKVIAGRLRDAVADFASPALAEERSAALWRGYIAQKLGDMTGARQQFSLGRLALPDLTGRWKARLARSITEADLAGGDLSSARQQLAVATGAIGGDEDEEMSTKLVAAKLVEATGRWTDALALYDEIAKARYGAVAAPAALRAVQLRLAHGQMTARQAAPVLDMLRFRWRGDATELEVVRHLGQINLAQGRYREALEVLRSASRRLADLPAAAAIRTDLSQTFRALFLEGRADGLQPIQALGLFLDFKELTPIGADGDTMVRRLVRRLVDVDLLAQAAELLKYQADNRLEGVARADVATDLATTYLMDRRPEQALLAINTSRTTVLPTALNQQRRLIEARALLALGRTDHAMEVLANDRTPEVAALRAETAWRARNWPQAASIYDALLGERWKSSAPLSLEEESRLTRAGVAYSLAGDDASLARLRSRYIKLAEGSRNKEVIQIALSGLSSGDVSPAAYGRAVAEVDTFAGWVSTMKKRFLERSDPRAGSPAVARKG